MCDSVRRKLGHTNASLQAHVQHSTAFSGSFFSFIAYYFYLSNTKEGGNKQGESAKVVKLINVGGGDRGINENRVQKL